MLVRSYLRASTDEQDAARAREQLEVFAAERGLRVAGTYVENESGAKLARPELFRLLTDSKPGDVLLIEQVDRLSRLTSDDWQRFRAELGHRQIRDRKVHQRQIDSEGAMIRGKLLFQRDFSSSSRVTSLQSFGSGAGRGPSMPGVILARIFDQSGYDCCVASGESTRIFRGSRR